MRRQIGQVGLDECWVVSVVAWHAYLAQYRDAGLGGSLIPCMMLVVVFHHDSR